MQRAHLVYGRHRLIVPSWIHGQKRFYIKGQGRRVLRSLDPERIPSSGQVPSDISQLTHVSYCVRTHDSSLLPAVRIRYTTKQRQYLAFPDNTHGFLYYKSPKPGYPDISGSFRFRIISSLGPDSFANGVDLTLPIGDVWEMHLYSVVQMEERSGLVTKLLEEGLVPLPVVKDLRNLPPALLHAGGQILYKLDDPFVARLHGVDTLVCMSQESVEIGQIMPMFFDSRKNFKIHPYEGLVRARFERSEHAKTRTVHLRILEELSPIRCVLPAYDYRIAMPTVGGLLSGFPRGKQILQPWSADLDKGKGKATRMLSLLWPRDPDGKN